ncbi:MAG: GCN5-related N-acetyltransferase [Flavipsychrobacter sp.]|jgi:ribosomal-protein-serine acetyltransferase|nr:GCN5-related N-acetyltransferase [Flavipsychrobacter sp.]
MTINVDNKMLLEIVDDQHTQPIFELANKNREHLGKWLPWINYMHSVDFIKNFVDSSKKKAEDKTDFAYVIVYENEVVGRIGVYNIDHQNKIGSIGYWMASEFEGKGLTTRACKELIKFCFTYLGLNRIEIKCGTENTRSKQIPERLGFTLEGIIREGEHVNDRFIDLYSFSMLKKDWITDQTD